MNNAVCIGYGYVGKATAKAFSIENYLTRHKGTITLREAAKCKYIFICLPTPTIDGKVFTEDIESTVKSLSEYAYSFGNEPIFIIRSTVPPGFAKYLQESSLPRKISIVSNPEFLSEATWEEDAVKPKMVVIGGQGKPLEAIKGLYQGRFKYSQPLITDNTTAEMIKYAFNTFFATKVVFSNEMFDACQKFGANYGTVKRALENHPWGMRNHQDIFYKGRRGVHGNCLPKDTEAFANLTESKLLKVVSEARYE